MRRKWTGLILFFLAAAALAQTAPQTLSSVPPARLAHIRRGINLSEWFAQVWDPKGYTKEHFQSWNTPADIALIKSMGFDHVRLSVNPQPMMDAARQNDGTAEYFGYLDDAVKMILDAGLAVEIDMHPDSDFKERLTKDTEPVERYADFWSMVARHYASWDPERVFFEILNEPEFKDAYRWYGVEAKLAAAIRRAAPQHTIIATGARWDDDDDLVFLEPLPDSNVIYVFHFYEPHIFTHQGATWGAYYWHWLKGLHYPSSPENAAQVAAGVPEAVDRFYVIRYGQDHQALGVREAGPAEPAVRPQPGVAAQWHRLFRSRPSRTGESETIARGRREFTRPPRSARFDWSAARPGMGARVRRRQTAGRLRALHRPLVGHASVRRTLGARLAGSGTLRRHPGLRARLPPLHLAVSRLGDQSHQR